MSGENNGNKRQKLSEVDEETLNSGAEGYANNRLFCAERKRKQVK